jgi:hypothetical protein
MTAPTLWIEITLAGAVYAAAICFFFLGVLRVDRLPRLEQLKELLPYIAVIAVGVSYILGIVMHRLVQVVSPMLFHWTVSRFWPSIVLDRPDGRCFADEARIWQSASERVHREIDFQFGLVALFRSLIFSVPMLWMGVMFWFVRAGWPQVWSFVGLGLVLWISCGIAFRRQWVQYDEIKAAALAEVDHARKT